MAKIRSWDERSALKIEEATRRVLRHGTKIEPNTRPTRARGGYREGRLTSALTAAGLAAPSTATVQFWARDPDSEEDPPPYIETDEDEVTVVNRSASLTGAIGTYVIVASIASEWRVIWADCED